MSENSYVKQLVDEYPWVDWTVELDHNDGEPRADLWAVVTNHQPDTELRRRAVRWNRCFLICLSASLVLLFSAISGWTVVFAAFAGFAVSTVVSFFYAQVLADKASVEVSEVEREASCGAVVADYVDPLWVRAFQQNLDAQGPLVEWLLALDEIDELEARIERGVQVRNRLSPTDPMRGTLQVEVETLRSRQDMLRADRQEQAAFITQSAREYLDEKRRERAAAEERRRREEERRKYEGRMRTIGDEEQARLEAHERAHEWLHEQD